jgi:hypothetical protein
MIKAALALAINRIIDLILLWVEQEKAKKRVKLKVKEIMREKDHKVRAKRLDDMLNS